MNRPARTFLIAAAVAVLVSAAVVAPRVVGRGTLIPSGSSPAPQAPLTPWEADNPLRPLPAVPAGLDRSFADLSQPPTPERVQLGRWLFFDKRLSGDGTLSCASCHRSDAGFSERTPTSIGIGGQLGVRKAPPILNAAFAIGPSFFWDGRAKTLEEQALGPITNPIEMGNTHERMVATLAAAKGYAPYFRRAFGDERVTADRVAAAIADYERTRLSGNSPWDRWRAGDESAVSEQVKQGHKLFFFGKASCNACHLGPTFADGQFHNLGVGWDAAAGTFKDEGRYAVTKKDADRGAFKTPTLRDVARRAPYMHDGSQRTLREVVEFYNRGGERNPHLSDKIKPLNLDPVEVDALVAFMEALDGEGFADDGPTTFPR
ncbi:MAG TPA: cytochrome c peroxidase [Humisphaera sp.]